jgi:hypothetical protein
VQIAARKQREGVSKWAIWVGGERVDLVERRGEVGIRPQVRGDFGRARFVSGEPRRLKRRITGREFVFDFRPGERLLRERHLRPAHRNASQRASPHRSSVFFHFLDGLPA